jgi:hypothetical protein
MKYVNFCAAPAPHCEKKIGSRSKHVLLKLGIDYCIVWYCSNFVKWIHIFLQQCITVFEAKPQERFQFQLQLYNTVIMLQLHGSVAASLITILSNQIFCSLDFLLFEWQFDKFYKNINFLHFKFAYTSVKLQFSIITAVIFCIFFFWS